MKITNSKSKRNREFGTVYYRCSLAQVISALQESDANVWIIGELSEYGWSALDLDNNLFGSKIIRGTLYICRTDGYMIDIDGTEVDPEQALSEYGTEDLSAYIQDATDDIICASITGYELKFKDIENTAIQMLESGVSLKDLIAGADELNLV